jgi:DNA-binding response OmpR family regulator
MARILVAEADCRVRTFISGILADFGHEVRECADGAQASRLLASRDIDIIVTDLVLSGDAGALTRDAAALGVPIVTLTGRSFVGGSATGSEPPQALVDKPFRFADLQSVVDAVAAQAPATCTRSKAAA